MDVVLPCSCSVCAAPPFPTYDPFFNHFVDVHRPSLFPIPNFWGPGELNSLTSLIILLEKYLPSDRKVNIRLSALVGCEPTRMKRIKETVSFKNLLILARKSQAERPESATIPPNPELICLDDFDLDENSSIDLESETNNIRKEIHNISLVLKDKSDSVLLSNPNSCSFSTLLPYNCLFCSRRFSSKSGLGLHRKSRHFEEYILEIEHKFANRRIHPWDDEELRMLYEFEQDLIGKGIRFINI